MFKWLRRWYNETPQQVRYSWIISISGFAGILLFAWTLWQGSSLERAILNLAIFGFDAGFLASIPLIIADLRSEKFTVWPRLDEMQKQIHTKARAATAVVFYLYFGITLISIMSSAESSGADTIPVSVIRHVFWGALFIWIYSLSISTVVIYSRGDAGGESENGSASGQEAGGQ